MKKVIAALLIAGATLALSGCTVGGDDRAVPATHSPTASAPRTPRTAESAKPTTAPITQPTPTPTEQAPYDSGWRFTTAGYGPIRIGSDATAILTDALFTEQPGMGSCVRLWNWSSGDSRKTGKDEWELTTALQDGRVRYIYATVAFQGQPHKVDGQASTDTGITFGSTAAEVQAAYPGIRKTQDTWTASTGGYREWVTGAPGGYLVIQTTGGPDADHDYVWSLRTIDVDEQTPICPQ